MVYALYKFLKLIISPCFKYNDNKPHNDNNLVFLSDWGYCGISYTFETSFQNGLAMHNSAYVCS